MMQPSSKLVQIISPQYMVPFILEVLRKSNVNCERSIKNVIICEADIHYVLNILHRQVQYDIRRYLDVYLLVLPIEPNKRQAVIDVFFTYIATNYDFAIDIQRNQDNIRKLIDILIDIGIEDESTIIDFGCGTGVSKSVYIPSSWRVIGVDRCPTMREIASRKGMMVLDLDDLPKSIVQPLDAAFCSYSMHMVFNLSDLSKLWNSMRDGGTIVANFHKGVGVNRISLYLESLGAQAQCINVPNSQYDHGPYHTFKKIVSK